jgi:hypothetical protein
MLECNPATCPSTCFAAARGCCGPDLVQFTWQVLQILHGPYLHLDDGHIRVCHSQQILHLWTVLQKM